MLKNVGNLSVNDPFFLFYDSRSGSTFLASLLVKHSHSTLSIAPEINMVSLLFSQYQKEIIRDGFDLDEVIAIISQDAEFQNWYISPNEIRQALSHAYPISIREFILAMCKLYMQKHHPQATLFGFKKGSYRQFYQRINKLFPDAKFIGLIRDGRAVFNSKKHSLHTVTGKPFTTDPVQAALRWRSTVKLLRQIRKEFPERTLLIHYEELVHNPVETVLMICTFLNVQCHAKPETESKYILPERYNELQPNIFKSAINSRIDDWKNSLSAEEILVFESLAYKQLVSEGYKLTSTRLQVYQKRLSRKRDDYKQKLKKSLVRFHGFINHST